MRTLVRVLAIGFAAVILALMAATAIGVNNARVTTGSAAALVADELVIAQLVDGVGDEQTVLNTVFYRLSRGPGQLDRERILSDLDRTDQDTDRLVAKAAGSPNQASWRSLQNAMHAFTAEARRVVSIGSSSGSQTPDTPSRDLFFRHEAVTAEVARLVDQTYARALNTQADLERQAADFARQSYVLVGACLIVALICAGITVRLALRVFRQMEQQAGELNRVSFRLLDVQESTARQFSHELHDELGGSLTAIKSNLGAIAASSPAVTKRVEDCTRLVDESISNVRELSQLLRPTILDDFGLDAGLRWLAERFSERTNIDVEYRAEFTGRLPDQTETHLFRIVQEALTNVARHSGARHVTIRLWVAGNNIHLTVADDGRGLAPDHPTGMGLSGMHARAASAGGELKIISKPQEGVTIEVTAPMEAAVTQMASAS
jgi:signal transduction histidine kinase